MSKTGFALVVFFTAAFSASARAVPEQRSIHHRGRRITAIDTSQHTAVQAHVAQTRQAVVVLFNQTGSSFGHLLLKVGDTFGDLGGTRFASVRNYGDYVRWKTGMVGFQFNVTRPENLAAVEAEMRREIESLRNYNLPVFSSYSRPTALRPTGQGRWEVIRPARIAPQNESYEARGTVDAELISQHGTSYLRSPNGVLVPATLGADGIVHTDARSCTSWPTELLTKHAEALGIPRLGLRLGARGLASELLTSQTHVPDQVWAYTNGPDLDLERFASTMGR